MTIYRPDKWVVVKVENTESPLYKVFGSWSGGYASGDHWRMNSGIVRCEKFTETFRDKEYEGFEFFGHSGSSYQVFADSYGVAGLYNLGIIQRPIDEGKLTMLPEDTDWVNFEYV